LPADVAVRLDVDAAAKRCDGFVVGDLCRVVRRALLQTTVRGTVQFTHRRPTQRNLSLAATLHFFLSAGDNFLTDENLVTAVDASRPVGQRTVQRVDNDDDSRNWAEVGGMTQVRRVLTQVLVWPVQVRITPPTAVQQ
jgi:hypothetical protein